MDIKLIKKLRNETGISIADIKRALENADNDISKAKELLNEWGLKKAAKKEDREISAGIVESYIHAQGRIGALISLGCETDYVARNKAFKNLAKEIALQVAAMNPKTAKELLDQAYIRDPKITIGNMLKQMIAKLGENIQVTAFSRQSF